MKQDKPWINLEDLCMPRRQFVKGVAMGGLLLGLGLSPEKLLASSGSSAMQPTLKGKKFNLDIAPQAVNFTGKNRLATAINGTVPGPILRWKEGDRITLNVSNHLAESTSVHWHGFILPAGMDGVPDISYKGIAPGETFHYQFDLSRAEPTGITVTRAFRNRPVTMARSLSIPLNLNPSVMTAIMRSCSPTGQMKIQPISMPSSRR